MAVVNLSVKSEVDQATKQLDGFTGGLLKSATAVAGLTAVLKIMDGALRAQAESEAAVNQLNLALANQGNYSKEASQELQEYADHLQQVSTFEGDAAVKGMAFLASLGMTTTQIKEATSAAAEYAAATGTDLAAAQELMGKAFVGNTRALEKMGFQFTKGATDAQKFDQAMKQVNERFGGSAAAQLQTYTGQMKALENTAGDVQEAFGKMLGELGGGGGGGGFAAAQQGLVTIKNFFGRDLIVAIGAVRAEILRLFASMAESSGRFSTLFTVAARVADPLNLTGLNDTVRDVIAAGPAAAKALRDEANEIERLARASAEAPGKIAEVTNQTDRVGRSADEAASKIIRMTGAISFWASRDLLGQPRGPASEVMDLPAGQQRPDLFNAPGMIHMFGTAELEDHTGKVKEAERAAFSWSQALQDVTNAMQALGIEADSTLGRIMSLAVSAGSAIDNMLKGGWQGWIAGISTGIGVLASIGGMLFGDHDKGANQKDKARADRQVGLDLAFHEKQASAAEEAQRHLNDAMEEYGFTAEEMGASFQQAGLNDRALELFQSFTALTRAGASTALVTERMSEDMSDYVNTAVASGSTIPAAMQDTLLTMQANGQLMHENGEAYTEAEVKGLNYAQTMEEMFARVVDSIELMVQALTGLPLEKTITVNTNYTTSGTPPPGGSAPGPEGPDGSFAVGTGGWRTVPYDGYTAELHRGERFNVVPAGQAARGGGGTGGGVTFMPGAIQVHGVSEPKAVVGEIIRQAERPGTPLYNSLRKLQTA